MYSTVVNPYNYFDSPNTMPLYSVYRYLSHDGMLYQRYHDVLIPVAQIESFDNSHIHYELLDSPCADYIRHMLYRAISYGVYAHKLSLNNRDYIRYLELIPYANWH